MKVDLSDAYHILLRVFDDVFSVSGLLIKFDNFEAEFLGEIKSTSNQCANVGKKCGLPCDVFQWSTVNATCTIYDLTLGRKYFWALR